LKKSGAQKENQPLRGGTRCRRLAPPNKTRPTSRVNRTFHSAGNAVVTLDALDRGTTNVLDALNRAVEMQLADGTKRYTIYDELGRRVGEVDQAGVTNRFGFDGLGRLLAATNAWATPNATWATYKYDEAGNQTNQTDALGRTTRYAFDKLGRRTGRTLPGGQSEGFAYNAAGNPTWHTNFNGQAIRMDYDAASRLLARVYPDGTSNTFAYTITVRRWKMTDASGVTTNRFDNQDRLNRRTHEAIAGLGPSVWQDYTYDARGNLGAITISDYYSNIGTELNYTHDTLNRLSTVSDQRLAEGLPKTTAYHYDGLGNLEHCAYPSGMTHAWRYNSLNRLTNLLVVAGAVALAQYDYALGVSGQRESLIEHVNGVRRTNDWKYDRLYRLTNEFLRAASGTVTGEVAYAYDGVANRTNRTSTLGSLITTNSTFNTNDWLAADVYDSAGNTRTNAAGVVYEYNADNQLTNVIHGPTNIALVYDADGNRISKTVSVSGSVTARTYYVVDHLNHTGYAQVLEEWDANSCFIPTSKRIYHYGLDLISQRVGSTPAYYGYDGHGSVRLLTDTSTNVTDTFTFDAYGTLIARTGTNINRFLYAGEQWDEDLGFYYLRARYLNPETGRFLTMDSHPGDNEHPLSLHKYLYCHANPVNGIDPSGHENLISVSIANAIGIVLDTFYNEGVINLGFVIEESLLESLKKQTVAELFMEALSSEVPIEDPVGYVSARLREMGVSGGEAEAYAFREYFDFALLPLLLDEHEYVDNDLDLQDLSDAGFQCFVAGTKVLTADGLKNIEEIRAGDSVWAYDTGSSNVVLKSVLHTFVRERDSLVKLIINDDLIEVTPEHPFFVQGRGWVRAVDLREGDPLLTFDSENEAHVRRAERCGGTFVVYNFEVEGLHNYFVADEAVLVHNLGRGYHHFVTRGLGSRIPYGARILRQQGRLTAYQHTHLHKALNRHLRGITKNGRTMMPGRGNPGRQVVRTFSRSERIAALGRFYRTYQQGKYYPAFQREVRYLQQNPGLFR
jgi:RHS repeat-associated protein